MVLRLEQPRAGIPQFDFTRYATQDLETVVRVLRRELVYALRELQTRKITVHPLVAEEYPDRSA